MEKDNRVEELNAANDIDSESDYDETPRNVAEIKTPAAPQAVQATSTQLNQSPEYKSLKFRKYLFLIVAYIVATLAFYDFAKLYNGPYEVEKSTWGSSWLPTFDHVVVGSTGLVNMLLLCCAITGRTQRMYALFAGIIYLASATTLTVLGMQNLDAVVEVIHEATGKPEDYLRKTVYTNLFLSFMTSLILAILGFSSSWLFAATLTKMRSMEKVQNTKQKAVMSAERKEKVNTFMN